MRLLHINQAKDGRPMDNKKPSRRSSAPPATWSRLGLGCVSPGTANISIFSVTEPDNVYVGS
jgi:hypothetical protein